MDHQSRAEVSYKIESVRPSFSLSVRFLRIGSLLSFEKYHGVRDQYMVEFVKAEFFEKNPHKTKMTKNCQKWPKHRDFGLFKKIMSFVLSRICVKGKFFCFINIL